MLMHRRCGFALFGSGAALAAALASILLFSGWPWTVHAQGGTGIILVSTAGTDAPGCGTVPIPCRTIKYALETEAQPGDTVSVGYGTYTETLTMQPGVVVFAMDPEQTIIDGEGVRGPMVYAGDPAITATAAVWYFTIQGGRDTSLGGGGVSIGGGASPQVKGCVIRDNVASSSGGGIRIRDGSPEIFDNVIYGNTADDGGGVSISGGRPLIRGNVVYSNTAADRGGGIYMWGANPIVDNNAIYHNVADYDGGGLYMSGEATPTISYNTIYSNTAASRGGGIYMKGGSAPLITNNVVASNTEDGIAAGVATPTLDYNVVWANWPLDYSGGLSAGPNSISADPLFLDAGAGDLRLSAGSPAIDAGNDGVCPATDLRGIDRPVDGDGDLSATCDIGAYEHCACDVPRFIACGQRVTGDTTGHIAAFDGYPNCIDWGEQGPEDIYAFTLPVENSRITATLSGLAPGVDLDVFLLRDCGHQWCFAYGNEEAVATDLAPGRYHVAVDGFLGAVGSYTLSLECSERRVYLPIILKGE